VTYYRNVYTVEVLSDQPLGNESLESLHHLTYDGPCSGEVTWITCNDEVGKDEMATLLIAQGSSPDFLIHDENDENEGGT